MSRPRYAICTVSTVLLAALLPAGAHAQGKEDKPFDLKPFIPPVIALPPSAQVAPGTSSQTTLPTDRASPIYNPQAERSSGPGLNITIPSPLR